ncbi:MAG: PilZ domain-containing protein [Candidatus Omnitrophica bacterium]|nr:PilZ domain-containing protein [Candidatus Omnitrophota bacterium]
MFRHWFKRYQYPDTRDYLRLPASWPVKCEILPTGDDRLVTSSKDVSAGGVAILVQEAVPAGSRVRLTIYVPFLERSIPAQGRVVRSLPTRGGGFELGIRFEQIDPKDRQDLNQVIEEMAPSRRKMNWWRKAT